MNLLWFSQDTSPVVLVQKRFKSKCSILSILILVYVCVRCNAEDIYINGKLTSGLSYGGLIYQHILITEKSVGNSRSILGRSILRGRTKCFEQVKNGLRIPQIYIRQITHPRSMAQCEDDCLNAVNFKCKGFNYRYMDRSYPYSQFMVKCELSSEDTRTHGITILDYGNDEYEFYERINYGRDCGRNYAGLIGRDDDYFFDSFGQTECFQMYGYDKRMAEMWVRERTWQSSLEKCKSSCSKARHFKCKSLAYSSENKTSARSIDSDTKSYSSNSQGFQSYRKEDNCLLADEDASFIKRRGDLIQDYSFDFYELLDRNECGRYADDGYSANDFDFGMGREGRHVTVQGIPCYDNRGCKAHFMENFYRCDTDRKGTWDYCCRMGSRCEIERGSTTASCYVGVGMNKSQWRPCKIGTSRLLGRSTDPVNFTTEENYPKINPDFIELVNLTDVLNG